LIIAQVASNTLYKKVWICPIELAYFFSTKTLVFIQNSIWLVKIENMAQHQQHICSVVNT